MNANIKLNKKSEFDPSLICENCSTTIAKGLLLCPGCHRLVYAKRLKELVSYAENAKQNNDIVKSMALLREALDLLPLNTKQYQIISKKVNALSLQVDDRNVNTTPETNTSLKGISGKLASLGTVGLLIWKFKFVLTFLLTKGKLLLIGLTKAKTFLTMMFAFSIYLTIWGWQFALGIILSIYVHEMGHIAALKKFGIKSSVPAFIPGFGAFVRMKQGTINKIENARIGLAGPIWGLGAAFFCYVIFILTDLHIFGAIAKVGAWINLFNLLPIMPLDGGRGFVVMNAKQQWIASGVIGIMWFLTREGLLMLILVVAIFRAFMKKPNESNIEDKRGLIEYSFLIIVLSIMSVIEIQV